MAGLDPRYIPLYHLQQDFLNKQTGLQLAGGVMYSFHDNNRTNPKALYELSGAPPNYTYTQLPNPITLSNAGTVTDGFNNDITVYAFPYDADGNPDNYYIQVFDKPSVPPFPPVGTPILTREAVPGVVAPTGESATGPHSLANLIANSQFAQVNFNPATGMVVSYGVGVTTVDIAPGWTLKLTGSGAGTVTVTRNAIAGTSQFATNPPYSLTLTPNGGASLTQMMLYQRLDHNPNIFATTNPPGANWVNAGIALANNSQTVQMFYAPLSAAVNPPLFIFANPSGLWEYNSETSQIPNGGNPNNSDSPNGYVDIQLLFVTTQPTTFSSVQLVQVADDNTQNVAYNQVPVNQQVQTTSFYFDPKYAYKPIPSYLVGWDFPKNPAQPMGDTITSAEFNIGANKSQYVWDQTIVFQSVNQSVGVTRSANTGALVLTCALAGQVAVIQYLDKIEAKKILSDRISSRISASTTAAGGLNGKVTLYACTGNLPDIHPGTNNSIVATLAADGKPATLNGITWTEIPNLFQNTSFTLQTASATNEESADIILNGWNMQNAVPTDTADFFAIVVGFAPWIAADTITLNSISLCPGDVPTRPAPKTLSETQLDSQRYYWSTFPIGTRPIQGAGIATGFPMTQRLLTGTGGTIMPITLPVNLRAVPEVTFYNPVSANALARNVTVPEDCTTTAVFTSNGVAPGTKMIIVGISDNNGGTAFNNVYGVHITADARLGIVN